MPDLECQAAGSLSCVQVGGEWSGERAGGLNRYFSGLVRQLRAGGHDVRALALGEPGPGDPPGETLGPIHAPLPLRLFRVRRRAGPSRQRDVDLCVSHFAPYTLPLLPRRRRPLVVHFHGPWAAESAAEGAGASARLKRRVEQATYHAADRVVVLSAAFRDLLVTQFGVRPERVSVVPGGIDSAAFSASIGRAAAREALGWDADRPTVVCVRRLVRRMGLERLVDAAKAAARRVPELRVKVYGRGPLAAELASRIDASGARDVVELRGFIPDERLPLVYRAADLSVVPSETLEGFGLTTLESLAAGTPVLVSPVGGLPEAVGGLSPSLVLADTKTETLADALAEALRDPARLPSAHDCGEYVRRQFDWQVIAPRVAAVYRSVL
jgi:glycosyltransferase involved in cell wall biosynthesis